MLKIGDFSSLTKISIKTLRHYDDVGLLPPARVDPTSGYRYYSASQLPTLHRILALKDLGFSLEEIRRALDSGISSQELRGMLRLRQAEQAERVREEQERLTRIEARLMLIEQEENMTQPDVIRKSVGPQWIASVRSVVPNYPGVTQLYPEVAKQLGAQACGPSIAIWHDPEFKEQDVDAEAGVLLKGPVQAGGRVKVYEQPAMEVASIIHQGAFSRLNASYDTLLKWVDANGLRVAGPVREVYLQISMPVTQDNESYVTEIQVPVSAR